MKLPMSFLKMVTKIIVLMIIFVCLFLISAFLYSTRYWPDVYNYINANITIERIPTISELKIQIVEVGYDYTTDGYSTTDADYFELSTTDDFDIDEFMTAKFDAKTKVKRNVALEEMKDYKELPSRPIFIDYVFLEEPIEMENKENYTEREDLLRTTIRKEVIDSTEAIDTDRYIITKDKFDNDDSNKDIVTIMTEKESNKKEENSFKDVREYRLQHTTTGEGYLFVEEIYETKNQPTEEPLHNITTDKNENEINDETGLNLLKDLVDVSNLSTRGPEDVEMVARMLDAGHREKTFKRTVFPWVATIFIKNKTENSQFSYVCDGALLSDKVIITGGRCVYQNGEVVDPQDILVFLGRENLQAMGGREKLHRIKNVILHYNFTTDIEGSTHTRNDLAILIMEELAGFDDIVQSSCIHFDETAEVQEAATTAWGPNGQLLPIFFEKERSDICFDKDADIFCATYGQDVPLCPSYGGIYATKRASKWCLEGLFYGDPAYRGLCFNKNVLFTSLLNYFDWIDDYILISANKL